MPTGSSFPRATFTFKDIIGSSGAIRDTIRLAKIASSSDSSVVIHGESGTGKEILAQAIHNSSRRKDGPFIALNCAAVPRDLIESELFGYVEGAFTGAVRGGASGKFLLAHGGTIFLDELGDMPLYMQSKLLRVLSTGEFYPVGGRRPVSVNVRVIAATHKNLRKLIEEGAFREDLFWRLAVLTINIPPLRERTSDIPELVRYFISKLEPKFERGKIEPSPKFIEALKSYSWPGNVRELQNLLEREICHLGPDEHVLNHIPDSIISSGKTGRERRSVVPLETLEKDAIESALRVFGYRYRETARALGIGRATLYRKIRKYAIPVPGNLSGTTGKGEC